MLLQDFLQLDEKDQIKRFGQLSALKDLVDEEIAETKPAALAQIRDMKGCDFTGRFQHSDGHTYEVRTDFDYPNIMDYDEDDTLRALLQQKKNLQKKSAILTRKINAAKDDIIDAHPKMAIVAISNLAYIRKEAQNA